MITILMSVYFDDGRKIDYCKDAEWIDGVVLSANGDGKILSRNGAWRCLGLPNLHRAEFITFCADYSVLEKQTFWQKEGFVKKIEIKQYC